MPKDSKVISNKFKMKINSIVDGSRLQKEHQNLRNKIIQKKMMKMKSPWKMLVTQEILRILTRL